MEATQYVAEESVHRLLIEKGYVKGAKISSFSSTVIDVLDESGVEIQGTDIMKGGCVIKRNGEWAQVMESPEPLPELMDYVCKIKDSHFVWGELEIEIPFFMQMKKNGITSLKLKHNGTSVKISEKKLNQIYDYLDNKDLAELRDISEIESSLRDLEQKIKWCENAIKLNTLSENKAEKLLTRYVQKVEILKWVLKHHV